MPQSAQKPRLSFWHAKGIAENPPTQRRKPPYFGQIAFPQEGHTYYQRLKRKVFWTSMPACPSHNLTRLLGLRTIRESRMPRNCLGRRTLAQIRPLGSGTRRPNSLRTVFEIAVRFITPDKTYNLAAICIVYKALREKVNFPCLNGFVVKKGALTEKKQWVTEGFHRKMKLIQRMAYGYKNFENYRLRVLVLCGVFH